MAHAGGSTHFLTPERSAWGVASGGIAMMLRTIDLTTIRVHLGERFASMSQRLHAQLQKDLKQALTGNGWYWPMGDLFYAVVLWGKTDVESDAIMQAVVAQLHATLRALKVDTTGLFIPINAAHLDRRGRLRVDAIQSLEEGDERVPEPIQVAAVPAPPKGNFAFEPVWNVKKGVVSAFRCVPRQSPAHELLPIGDSLTATQEAARAAIEDQELLQHAIDEWKKLSADSPCLLIVPVRFETLASAGPRRDYLGLCGEIPNPLRRLLIFDIEQVPDGVMAERLSDVTRYLKTMCRATMARVSLEFQHCEAVQKAGILIISCHIGSTRNEQRSLQLMERFVERAEKSKLQTAVFGIRSVSLTTASLAAGFDYIGGEAVSTLSDTPRGLFKFDAADVYREATQPANSAFTQKTEPNGAHPDHR